MASNKRTGSKIVAWADRTSNKGIRLDTATFIGIIKNNLDPSRTGRLQIWVPDLGGDENNPSNWRTVSYASPFFGVTFNPAAASANDFKNSAQTYGMWAVPPDIDNEVLCTFVNGDPDRGYWFACVHSQVAGHYMMPGLAAGNLIDTATASADVKSYIDDNSSAVPVVEFNENKSGSVNSNFYNNPKPVHETQFKRLLQQGLDKDRTRGAISSSSQRESPSTVFGISTAGRYVNDPATNSEFQSKLENGTLSESDLPTGARQGGHSFVMDDGDFSGVDNLIRLRSSAGHQILMNDEKRLMYISNSEGSVWLEFAENGQMHIYSSGGLNIRTEGDLNLHSDKNINITAKKKLNITGNEAINIESNEIKARSLGKMTLFASGLNIGSDADLNLYAETNGNFKAGGKLACVGSQVLLNSGGGITVAAPKKLSTFVHNDTTRDDPNGPWKSVTNSVDSLSSILPSHEPWKRQTGVNRITGDAAVDEGVAPAAGPVSVAEGGAPEKIITATTCDPKGAVRTDPEGNPIVDGSGNPVRESIAELDAGPKLAATKPVSKPMPKEWLNRDDVPNPSTGIGPLSQHQVKCLMAQIAFSESRFDYSVREASNGNYLGRYQVGSFALTDLSYMKVAYTKKYSTTAVRYPDAWLGTDNLVSDTAFLAAKGSQEKIMFALMQMNYKRLTTKSNGKYGINPDDDLCTVAGMLQVAHLLGAGGARTWRYTAAGGDANGTSGAVYYNRGRYAIDVLANGGLTAQGSASTLNTTTRIDKSGLTPAAQEAAAANIDPNDVMIFSEFQKGQNTGSGSYQKFMAMSDNFRVSILGAARDYKKATGEKLHCTSALRTQKDQTLLYNAWIEGGGNKKSKPRVGTIYGTLNIPAERVGNHGSGKAMDAPDRQVSKMRALGLFEKYGLEGVNNDPPHMQQAGVNSQRKS